MLSRFSKLSQAFAKRRSFSTIVEEPVKKSVPTMDFSNMGSGNLNTDPEMQHHIEQCRRIQAEKNIPVYETVIVDHELAQVFSIFIYTKIGKREIEEICCLV